MYEASDKKSKVVMVSSMTAPFFMQDYLVTKREAEKFLIERSNKFDTTILRPGLIWHLEERKWGMIFLPMYSKIYYEVYKTLVKKKNIDNIGKVASLLTPLPTSLEIMAQFTIEALERQEHHEPHIIDAYDMAERYFEKR